MSILHCHIALLDSPLAKLDLSHQLVTQTSRMHYIEQNGQFDLLPWLTHLHGLGCTEASKVYI